MKHPSEDLLLAHASGHLDAAMRVVVEAHLDLCRTCRGTTAELSAPGGRWLAGLPGDAAAPQLWDRLASRLGEASRPDPIPASVPMPLAARRELPADLRLRWWRPLLRGARMAILTSEPASATRLALAHMPGGRIFPRHEHLGFEHAVVLAGGYEDERGEFLAGDFEVYEPGTEHGPHTLDGDDCWILFRLQGAVRFRGWRGALQRLLPGARPATR
jgi:putative transcriptional regulator